MNVCLNEDGSRFECIEIACVLYEEEAEPTCLGFVFDTTTNGAPSMWRVHGLQITEVCLDASTLIDLLNLFMYSRLSINVGRILFRVVQGN